jgi:hypothetical protein
MSEAVCLRSPLSTLPAGIIVPTFRSPPSLDDSSLQWLGISHLIAEPEGPSFISRTVTQPPCGPALLVTQDHPRHWRPRFCCGAQRPPQRLKARWRQRLGRDHFGKRRSATPKTRRAAWRAGRRFFKDLTADVLRRAMGSGMKVLDLGCGVGDVSVLVARMVGESGAVLGIDRAARCASRYKHRGG